jgi:hypothetical protein
MVEEELNEALRAIWDDDNFVRCTNISLPTKENKEEMLNAILEGWVKDSDEVTIYSMAIYHDAPFEDEK